MSSLTVQGKAVPQDIRQKVLEDAKRRILNGETLAQIANEHGIAERTLEYWLASLGDEYIELRRAWIDGLLQEASELLKDTREDGNAALRLARARELWKRATWYAERRDRARYGQEAQVNVSHITVQLGTQLRGESATIAPQQGRTIENGEVIDA